RPPRDRRRGSGARGAHRPELVVVRPSLHARTAPVLGRGPGAAGARAEGLPAPAGQHPGDHRLRRVPVRVGRREPAPASAAQPRPERAPGDGQAPGESRADRAGLAVRSPRLRRGARFGPGDLARSAGVGGPVPGAPAHHRERGFANVNPSHMTAGAWTRFTFFVSRIWASTFMPRTAKFPQAASDLGTIHDNRGTVTVTWVGHATLLIQLD